MPPGRAVIVIPARYASTRLPGKPLLRATGKPLIQHAWEAVQPVARTLIATDDQRILDAARGFGAEACLTSDAHQSGTDRVAEVAAGLEVDFVINVQGDEPDLDPDDLRALLALLEAGAPMATLVFRSQADDDWLSPHIVKVAASAHGEALYFSRAGIPYARDLAGRPESFLVHLGVYGYRRETLLRLAALPPSPLEQCERLEQLRALEAGIAIKLATARCRPHGIDTPEDYRRFCERLEHNPETA